MARIKAKFKVGDKVKLITSVSEKDKIFTITRKIYKRPRSYSAIRNGYFRYKLQDSHYYSYGENELMKYVCTLKSLLE